ncbi:MAG TPA: hypothetical protein PLM75_04360 [bacterium]|nr:hypothetical protein [bacterium]HPP87080.1 hypothetical protein [bacterium]
MIIDKIIQTRVGNDPNLQKTTKLKLTFKGISTAGFSTYGEQYFGNINQTSTMLVFK